MALFESSSYNIARLVCVLMVTFSLSSKISICSGLNSRREAEQTPFFIFGDSFLDAGNNNYINTTALDRANFWPYGISFFHIPTGRFSDGRLISDFLAEHANLPLIPPYLQPASKLSQVPHGVNFASSGAGALVQTFRGSVINLHEQLDNYKKVEEWLKHKLGEMKARRKLTSAVHLFSIGSNDYISLFMANSTPLTAYTQSQYVHMVISNITSVVHEIYKIGGRKMVFLNLPPIGCFPVLRMRNENGECLMEASSYIKLHNEALIQALKQLAKRLPGFKYSLHDFYSSTLQRINQPLQYGYTEGRTACCGTGKFRGVFSCGGKRPVKQYELCNNVDEHVFWDSFHFTEKVYMQIADDMWSSSDNTSYFYGSYSIKDLFSSP